MAVVHVLFVAALLPFLAVIHFKAHEDFLGFYNVPNMGAETSVGYKRCVIKTTVIIS